jgi:hypothetical protein
MRLRAFVRGLACIVALVAAAVAVGEEPSEVVDPVEHRALQTVLPEFGAPAFPVGVDAGGAGFVGGPADCMCFPICVCDADCRSNSPGGLCACYWSPGLVCCWDACSRDWWQSRCNCNF